MAFPTYDLQQYAGYQQDSPGLSSAPGAGAHLRFHSPSQTAPWTEQPQVSATNQPLLIEVQTLKQQLGISLKKNREYEQTILHLATRLSSPQQTLDPVRTQRGIICPHCKQEVAHVCSSPPPPPLITSSSVQSPLNRYEQQVSTTTNLTGSQTRLTDPTSQAHLFGVTTNSASTSSHVRLPPSSVNIPSVFASHSESPYSHPLTSVTLGNPSGLQTHFSGPTVQGNLSAAHTALAAPASFDPYTSHVVPQPSSNSDILSTLTCHTSSLFVPYSTVTSLAGSSIAILSQYNSSEDNSGLGKIDLHHTDVDCGPEKKRVRPNLLEERSANQQSEFQPRQTLATFHSSLPSHMDSFPSLPFGLEDGEPESGANWIIKYNSDVKRQLDVSLVPPLQVGLQIICIGFSTDGMYLAVAFFKSRMVNIYHLQTGEKIYTLKTFIYGRDTTHISTHAVRFSPDGLYLATAASDFGYRIWKISNKHVRNFLGFSPMSMLFFGNIDFSPDGRLIAAATGTPDYYFEIHNWCDGFQKFSTTLEAMIAKIVFSPDGRHIVVGVVSGEVLIWNVRTGQLVDKLRGHRRWVLGLAFMPDGMGLLSAGEDGIVRCWDISSLSSRSGSRNSRMENISLKGVLRSHKTDVNAFAVSSNGRWVVSCSSYGPGAICISNARSAELHCEICPGNDTGRVSDVLYYRTFSAVDGFLVAAYRYQESRVFLWKIKEV